MALFHAHFFSTTLHVQAAVEVILPEMKQGIGVTATADADLPKVLYLLHGYSDDHTIWQRRTSVERYAAAHNLAIIMPSVNHSFYCNEVCGERYWDFVSDELPQAMQRFFRLSDKPEDTFVAGLSMGGYGAMKLALTYPERFAAAASFSGATDAAALGNNFQLLRTTGLETLADTPHDLMHLMKINADASHKPRLYVSCGTKDFLYGHHEKFVPALKDSGWDVTHYEEPNEVHSWAFWDREIAKVIPWLMKG